MDVYKKIKTQAIAPMTMSGRTTGDAMFNVLFINNVIDLLLLT